MRYENVDFHFLAAETDSIFQGTVIIRNGEMVIDIADGGNGPCVLVGKVVHHWYEGSYYVATTETTINAKWAQVGDQYVGIWNENNDELLFRFKLVVPSKT